jgi:hypothetical protein
MFVSIGIFFIMSEPTSSVSKLNETGVAEICHGANSVAGTIDVVNEV